MLMNVINRVITVFHRAMHKDVIQAAYTAVDWELQWPVPCVPALSWRITTYLASYLPTYRKKETTKNENSKSLRTKPAIGHDPSTNLRTSLPNCK